MQDYLIDFQIFQTNINCRKRIFSNILTSIDRMDHYKQNVGVYKLAYDDNEGIGMVTALVLQLIQFSTDLPGKLSNNGKQEANMRQNDCNKTEEEIMENWGTTVSLAEKFLQNFYDKYQDREVEIDGPVMLVDFENLSPPEDRSKLYKKMFPSPLADRTGIRQLFENFVNDLWKTVNLPEWPASEFLLNLLSAMLVKHISNKSTEHSMRIVSLKYLGTIAARMRKLTIESGYYKKPSLDKLINVVRGKLDDQVPADHIQ